MRNDWLDGNTSVPNRMLCELDYVEGQRLDINGDTYLIVTKAALGRWLATYLHYITESPTGAQCKCGVKVEMESGPEVWQWITNHWKAALQECEFVAERGNTAIF